MTVTTPDISVAASAPPPVSGRRRRTGAPGTRTIVPYTLLLPAIVLFVLFMAAPIVYTVVLSFQKSTVEGLGIGPDSRRIEWAGLENFAAVLTSGEFLESLLRMLVYGLILVPVVLGLAMLFALLLDSPRSRGRRFSRVAIFLPFAVPGVISSLLWGFLYLPGVSPINDIASFFGVSLPDPLSPDLVLFSIANIGLWGGVGFNMVIIFTALRSIPTEIYEAARIDGASETQIALRIKVPLVIPSIIMTSLFSIVATVQVFTEPTVLRPLSTSISSSWSPLMIVYRDAFIRDDIYASAATSIVLALGTFALSFLFLRVVQRRAFSQES